MTPMPYIVVTRHGKVVGIKAPIPVECLGFEELEPEPEPKATTGNVPPLYMQQVDDILAECEAGPDPRDPRNRESM